MENNQIHNLMNGSVQVTFEEAVASVFNYGYRQTVFEVERMSSHRKKAVVEEIIVLRPSATQVRYPLLKPGDEVHCPGLGKDGAEPNTYYRIRRMAEGFGQRTMTECA